MSEPLRIGGASGFWGDAAHATPQLLGAGNLDFIVYDYLAEITMAILAKARARDPELGFATDFVSAAMAPNLAETQRRGLRIISNAGGVNPDGCARALWTEIARQGLTLKVAVVQGDDVTATLAAKVGQGVRDMFTDAPFPAIDRVASANTYLGAFSIAHALDRGADIVITGRCVDSAVTLGACIHHFGWSATDLDLLAAGSLAGHILECGPQATGGNFTDWEHVADDLANIGYPIAEVQNDGTFDIVKPDKTGGLVSRATVAEQMLYEIGDPQAYILPDVICDFTDATIEETAPNRVRVSGAHGRGVPDCYKTCLTWTNGYRGGHLFGFYGLDAERKAQVFADAVLTRARSTLQQMNAPDFTETSVEIIGAESQFGELRTSPPSREVAAKIAVRHPDPRGIGVFLKEATGLGLSTPPGLCGFAGARPKPSPVLALFSYLTPKHEVTVTVSDAIGEVEVPAADAVAATRCDPRQPPPLPRANRQIEVPLIDLAWARSGDKGDNANIGVIARHPDLMPWIWVGLDDRHLSRVFGHFLTGRIERFYLPGTHSMNILLHGALGGGGTSSLRNDPQAKGYAQLLLAAPIPVDRDLVKDLT
jgi:acyclic terpene utilization AtuA family protein